MKNDDKLTTKDMEDLMKAIDSMDEDRWCPTTWSIPMSWDERLELDELQKTDPDEVQRRMREMIKERGAIEFKGTNVKNIHLSRRVHQRLLAMEEFQEFQQI